MLQKKSAFTFLKVILLMSVYIFNTVYISLILLHKSNIFTVLAIKHVEGVELRYHTFLTPALGSHG